MQTVKENVTGFNGTVTGDVTFYPSSEVFTINNASSFLLTPTLNIVSGFSFDMVVSVNGMAITSYSLLEMNGVSISRTGNNIVIVINGTTTTVSLIEDWYICLSVRYQNGVTSVRYSNTPFPSASAEVARETFDLPAGKIKMLEGAAGASLNICRGSSPRYDAVGDSIVYKAVQTGTQRHYWKNIYAPNATKYGTLTENNGVASGFSTSNYYNATLININNNNFDLVAKVYGYSTSQDNPVYANKDSRGYLPKIVVHKQGTIQVSLSNSTSGWNVCDFGSTESIPSDAWVWIKVSYDGTAYTINTSLDGQVYTEIGRYATTTTYSQNLNTIGACYDTGSTGLKTGYGGQIDLTGCYLNINGERVWDGVNVTGRITATAEDYDFYTDETVYKCWGRPSATIFESSTAGSYTANLESGNYNVILVGGGGGGVSTSNRGGHGFAAGGGSGGYSLIENVFIEGGEYTVVVGGGGARALYGQDNTDHYAGDGGDSYITIQSGILSAGGGGGGHSRYNSNYGGVSTGGAGGSGSTISGNSGNRTGESYNTTTAGGASVYGGYGVGGNGCATNPGGSLAGNTKSGTDGYVKIFYLGE